MTTLPPAFSRLALWLLIAAVALWLALNRDRLDLTTGPAALSFPGPIRFDENGRRQDVPMIFAQWQNGVPVTVFPAELALAKPYWLKES